MNRLRLLAACTLMVALGGFKKKAFTAGFSQKIQAERAHKLTERYSVMENASSMIKIIILIAVI